MVSDRPRKPRPVGDLPNPCSTLWWLGDGWGGRFLLMWGKVGRRFANGVGRGVCAAPRVSLKPHPIRGCGRSHPTEGTGPGVGSVGATPCGPCWRCGAPSPGGRGCREKFSRGSPHGRYAPWGPWEIFPCFPKWFHPQMRKIN